MWELTGCSICEEFKNLKRESSSIIFTGWASIPLGEEVSSGFIVSWWRQWWSCISSSNIKVAQNFLIPGRGFFLSDVDTLIMLTDMYLSLIFGQVWSLSDFSLKFHCQRSNRISEIRQYRIHFKASRWLQQNSLITIWVHNKGPLLLGLLDWSYLDYLTSGRWDLSVLHRRRLTPKKLHL